MSDQYDSIAELNAAFNAHGATMTTGQYAQHLDAIQKREAQPATERDGAADPVMTLLAEMKSNHAPATHANLAELIEPLIRVVRTHARKREALEARVAELESLWVSADDASKEIDHATN
jgi:iron-sulfur cluster repair protein YtfE (RIC family)